MTVELQYLTWVTLFTALLWVPYVLNMILVRGLIDAIGYPENPKPLSPWASRMRAAHSNAIENLVVFGILVLVVHAVSANSETTALACLIYFWARVVHFFSYAFGIPLVRTLAFVAGFACQVALALEILF